METKLEQQRAQFLNTVEKGIVRRFGVRRERIVGVGNSSNPTSWMVVCPECHQRRITSEMYREPEGVPSVFVPTVRLVGAFEVGDNTFPPELFIILTAECDDCGTMLWAKFQAK